ncbi:peptidyl-prolyl cis-trans isomerase FKBP8 [Microplitis mediator]|uniref:peptidyl-prolyl cis-trans isomerase FKBP8 n=1 Tax=Microplitis mediator TaxID=375433 RepID=UPI00255724C7|nr:peptidyl-prolyl cis-trans isomerase FKBP8 [Microplitis mediator]
MEPDQEYGSQADFIKDEFNFGVDPKDPYTKALLNEEPKEDEWMDILGNGQLKKKTIVKGQKGTRPNQGDLCTVDITGSLTPDGKEVFETLKAVTVQLGDHEVIQGLELALALMDVGEVAEVEIAARFGYGDVGRQPEIPAGAKLFYNVELKSVEMEPDIDSLTVGERKAIGNKKRERGNWWFSRDEPTIAIQCYRRALEFLVPGDNYDPKKLKDDKIITDSDLEVLLDDRTKVYNNLAAAQIKTEAYEAALESVDNVLRTEPHNVKALFRKGRILHKKGEYSSAVKVFQEAAKLDPESKAIQQELSVLKGKSARENIYEKKLYRKMLGGSSAESSSTESKKNSKPSKKSNKSKLAWSLIGGTLAAVTGVILYKLSF